MSDPASAIRPPAVGDASFDEYYYAHCCGDPYERTEALLTFFGGIADRLVADVAPKTVLDAGCAIGLLVEALRQRGVDATGIDMLHVYAYPNPGSGQAPIFLGIATPGVARSDVASAYGSRYLNSGYTLVVNRTALGLTPGVYNIAVHAHSTAAGAFNNVALVRVTLQ